MAKTIIQTDDAPQAIGTYSQAVKVDNTVYISGQIPLDPASMEVVSGGIGLKSHVSSTTCRRLPMPRAAVLPTSLS